MLILELGVLDDCWIGISCLCNDCWEYYFHDYLCTI